MVVQLTEDGKGVSAKPDSSPDFCLTVPQGTGLLGPGDGERKGPGGMGVKRGLLRRELLQCVPERGPQLQSLEKFGREGRGLEFRDRFTGVAGGRKSWLWWSQPAQNCKETQLGDRVTGGGQSKWCWEGHRYQGEVIKE